MKTGIQSNLVTGLSGIMRAPLRKTVDRVLAEEYQKDLNERREKKEATSKNKGSAPKHSDNEILEMRRLHEFCGVSRKELMVMFNIEPKSLSRYLGYITRSKLIPKKDGNYLN